MSALTYNALYFRSISGILKTCCLMCTFIGVNCIMFSSVRVANFRGMFYVLVAVICFGITTLVLFTRLYQLWDCKFYNFNVNKYESYMHLCLAFLMFVASILALSLDVVSYSIATFFGFLTFSFYIVDAYLGYRLSRLSDASTQTQPI